jgi:2-methylcitrate dehydratase PrpD
VVTLAEMLADWALCLEPTADEEALARRSLADTAAVLLAAAEDPLLERARSLGEAGQWATAAHLLDFDDLHMESTAHLSAVVLPVVLATGGGAHAYLAGAGVMARVGMALGWEHYTAGWDATCAAGAFGAAVAAAVSLGLNMTETAHSIALAVPAADGVQRALGTDAKSLQVGFAADAGVRAAMLAANGLRGDLLAVDDWLKLVARTAYSMETGGPAVPGGLAIKLHPCCYALQRPIGAVRQMRAECGSRLDPARIVSVRAHTLEATLTPLIHHHPTTGLQGKFSLEYALATALLDDFPTGEHFTDAAVGRPQARELMRLVRTSAAPGGSGLLDGRFDLTIGLDDGSSLCTCMTVPPGAPAVPPTAAELDAKLKGCLGGSGIELNDVDFADAARLCRERMNGAHLATARRAKPSRVG